MREEQLCIKQHCHLNRQKVTDVNVKKWLKQFYNFLLLHNFKLVLKSTLATMTSNIL